MQAENPTPAVTMLADEKRLVGAAALIAMLRMFGLFTLLPVLSHYAGQLDGKTPLLIGLAVGAYGLTQAVLQIPMGMLSERIGRRAVILGGLLVFAGGSVVAALADSIEVVILGRLLQGAGAISGTLAALITDGTREEVRTRSMAVLGIGIGNSFLAALIAGPIIAAYVGVPALFWLAAGLALLAAAVLRLVPDTVQQPVTENAWNIRPALRPELLRLDFKAFLLHAMLTATFVAMPFLLSNSLQLPLTRHWPIYAGALLVSLAGTIPLIVRDERQGKRATIAVAVILMMSGLLLLGFVAYDVWPVFIALALFFAGFNFLEASLPARLSILADPQARGASLGLFASSQFLGAFVGGLIGGRFMAAGRPEDVFLAAALLAAIWLVTTRLRRPG